MDTNPKPPIPVAPPAALQPDDAGYEYVDVDDEPRPRRRARRPPPLTTPVRVLLALMAVAFTAVFVTAACLRPYDPATGEPLTMATHTQLGLAPCNMKELTGKPCPACGMTTSFALLMHGDIGASLRANWVGTLIALFWLVLIPWGTVTVVRGRMWGIRNGELFLAVAVGSLVALMVGRWAVIMLS